MGNIWVRAPNRVLLDRKLVDNIEHNNRPSGGILKTKQNHGDCSTRFQWCGVTSLWRRTRQRIKEDIEVQEWHLRSHVVAGASIEALALIPRQASGYYSL